ncbi:hypothetical protein P43SY_005471 [Pythium insidiosum]|uniref:RING-type domain-containing protein n=1 Tax=Pythium insidiosum TaxID=114742 RepID=A0AAD5Q8R0_PYTIN|nr:hypothetical protein P43SY_005471 [Pythium insidiosum]
MQDQQAALKAQIRQIQSSKSLTPKEKAESVQKLMMKQWNENQEKVALTRQQSDNETERRRVTYHGLEIDYFHCDRCNACMSISLKKHKCVERSLESDCPICHTFMFTSTTPVMFLPCGHCMHVSCYEEYTLTNYICPLCSKSLGDMELYFASIDELLEREQMPIEYQDFRSLIYCSDCERKSVTNFHFVYHKISAFYV